MTTIEKVKEFQKVFLREQYWYPTFPSIETRSLRIRLLQEELDELKLAIDHQNMVEILDALCDIQYILDGTFLAFGLGILKEEAFNEVHRSNMSKLGEDGVPMIREDGKIVKGPHYYKPNLARFLTMAPPKP